MRRERNPEGELLRYALKYAGWGLRVLPLHSVRDGRCSCQRAVCASAGKHPRTQNGVKEATTDREQILAWWERWSDANVGIATGLYNGRGLYVIDLDIYRGATFESLEDCDLAELLCSRIARTGSGGYHIYLRSDRYLPNTINRLGAFIDTRGEGGYVVAPPSRNSNGPYVWEADLNRILPAPPALLARLEVFEMKKTTPVIASLTQKKENQHEISVTTSTSPTPDPARQQCPDSAPAAPAAPVPAPGRSERQNQQPRQPLATPTPPQERQQRPVSQEQQPAVTPPQKGQQPGWSPVPQEPAAVPQPASGSQGSAQWRRTDKGVYVLRVGANVVCLVPVLKVPGRYRCLARLEPDFKDETWFTNGHLAWGQTYVENNLRHRLNRPQL